LRAETASSSPAPLLADKKLYLVTPVRPDFDAFLTAAIRGGVDVVQIRDRDLSDRALLEALNRARTLTAIHRVPLGVNDRADLALLCGADFVHVGQDDIPTSVVRELGLPVGLSTHTPAEIDTAEADYIGVGPVYATPTKEGRPPVGVELVRHAAEHATVPWFAIGGIDRTNVEHVVAAGATRIAVVRAVGEAADPEAAARELRAALPG
jgi:thiamine-phosphate pyrophosphorylase